MSIYSASALALLGLFGAKALESYRQDERREFLAWFGALVLALLAALVIGEA